MRKIIIITIFVLSLLVIFLSLFFRPANPPLPTGSPTPTPVGNPAAQFNAIDYSKIFTDSSIEQQVKNVLKNPVGSEVQDNTIIVSFPTDIATRPNLVYEKSGVAMYIVQEITGDNTYLTDFQKTHASSKSFTLFDASSSSAGFSWIVYPQDGVAYLANSDSGYAIRVLYFSPTTKGDFIRADASFFQMSPTDPNSKDAPESFAQ